jgi:hypothetical protein
MTNPPPNNLNAILSSLDATPSAYCALRLNWTNLYPWQTAALDGIQEINSRVALRTCNESGKTRKVIAGAILWHMETFQRSTTVVTSGSWLQIEGQLIPSLKIAAEERGVSNRFQWQKNRGTCLATGSEIRWFSTDEAGRAEGWHAGDMTSDARGWRPEDNVLAGFGVDDAEWKKWVGERQRTSLLIVLDEAKSIAPGIWWAVERCHPTRLLVASSPGAAAGEFFDCFHAKKDRYMRVHASAKDCPHLWESPAMRAELEDQIKCYPKHLVDSMIWGDFSTGGDHELFDGAALTRAMSGLNPKWGKGIRRAAVDLSAGGDGSPMYICDGNEVSLVHEWHERDTHRLAQLLIQEFMKHQLRPEWIYMDNGGLGLPIIDLLHAKGWEVNRVNFGGEARRAKYFANTRAEMYAELATRIQNDELRLPKDDTELKDQLMWQKYVPKDGPLQLIPKQKLPKSPDRSDTLAMLMYDFPKASEYKSDIAPPSRTPRTGRWEWGATEEDDRGSGLWG